MQFQKKTSEFPSEISLSVEETFLYQISLHLFCFKYKTIKTILLFKNHIKYTKKQLIQRRSDQLPQNDHYRNFLLKNLST